MNQDWDNFSLIFPKIETLKTALWENKRDCETHIKAKKRDCETAEIEQQGWKLPGVGPIHINILYFIVQEFLIYRDM